MEREEEFSIDSQGRFFLWCDNGSGRFDYKGFYSTLKDALKAAEGQGGQCKQHITRSSYYQEVPSVRVWKNY